MGKIGYLELTNAKSGVTTTWLVMTLADGWLAAYRLTFTGQGRRKQARVAELRIVPAGPPHTPLYFSPDGWRVKGQAREGDAPFPFAALHRGITARHLKDALLIFPAEGVAAPPPHTWEPSPARRAAGRPGKARSFYAQFAVRYDEVENDENREGRSTREILADEYQKTPVTTIAKWIQTARRHGFLTPVEPGQRGGRATPLARTFKKRGPK